MKVNRIPFEVQVIENSIVQSDEDGIHTILSQFVENAAKYGDGSGIRIVMEKQEDTYYFSVFNKGELLPDSELPYVFRSFGEGPMQKASREAVWVCIRQGKWQNSCRERYM
ncbi:MAG: HAMP domain-containing histidine kinase [Lachnospiraceae bacterium]|nr:HAMP domain-containing histidine kinase [Lachnospiraceae bacterium]